MMVMHCFQSMKAAMEWIRINELKFFYFKNP